MELRGARKIGAKKKRARLHRQWTGSKGKGQGGSFLSSAATLADSAPLSRVLFPPRPVIHDAKGTGVKGASYSYHDA